MKVSPFFISGSSLAIVWSTGSPEGTMIQIARGAAKILHQIVERIHAQRSGRRQLRGRVFVEVEADNLMTCKAQAAPPC